MSDGFGFLFALQNLTLKAFSTTGKIVSLAVYSLLMEYGPQADKNSTAPGVKEEQDHCVICIPKGLGRD